MNIATPDEGPNEGSLELGGMATSGEGFVPSGRPGLMALRGASSAEEVMDDALSETEGALPGTTGGQGVGKGAGEGATTVPEMLEDRYEE